MYVNTVCAKETVTVMTGVHNLHFKASLLATSSPASMDVQVKHSFFFFFFFFGGGPWHLVTHLISLKKVQQSVFLCSNQADIFVSA
jgi:hypothetical protein